MSGRARVTDYGGNVLEIKSSEIGTPEYQRKVVRWLSSFVPADPGAKPERTKE